MPNIPAVNEVTVEEYEDESVGPDDFQIVIGPDGELKSFSIPEHLMEDPPEEVQFILEVLGIADIHQLTNRLLH